MKDETRNAVGKIRLDLLAFEGRTVPLNVVFQNSGILRVTTVEISKARLISELFNIIAGCVALPECS